LKQEREALEADRVEFEVEKTAMMTCGIGPSDLIGLNFRGEKTITVKRSLLCQVEGSMLAAMFSGRYEDQLDHDKDDNVFVDYPPAVMMPIMDRLTLCRDWPPEKQLPSIAVPRGYEGIWDSAVNFFGLESLVQPSTTAFSGIKANVKITKLKGWAVAWCKPVSENVTWADFQLPQVPPESLALIGMKRRGEDELTVAAIGRLDIVTSRRNFEGARIFHNGLHWYCSASHIVLSSAPFTGILGDVDVPDVVTGTLFLSMGTLGSSAYFPLKSIPDPDHALERMLMIPEWPMRIAEDA